MKANEAISAGFSYTGMSASEWDNAKWEGYKKEAQEIRKIYKGADFRVVSERESGRYGSTIWKSIYGNDIFCKVQYFSQKQEEDYLNTTHYQKLEALKKEYEQKVEAENQAFNKRKENYTYIMSLKKN